MKYDFSLQQLEQSVRDADYWSKKLEAVVAIKPETPPEGYETVVTWAKRWRKSEPHARNLCARLYREGIMDLVEFKGKIGRRSFAYKWIEK